MLNWDKHFSASKSIILDMETNQTFEDFKCVCVCVSQPLFQRV